MHDTYGTQRMAHTVMGLWCQADAHRHTSRHIHTNCSTGLRWLHMLLTRGSSVHLLNKSRRSCHRLCLAAAAAAASTGRGSLVQGALECVNDVSSTCTDARWLCRCPRTRRARVPRPGARLWRACACCDAIKWLGQRRAEKSREKQGSDHYLGGNCGLRGSRAKSRAHSSGAEPLAGTPS